MVNASVNWSALVDVGDVPIVVGIACTLNGAGTAYVTATTTNLAASASGVVDGIALTPASQGTFQLQVDGRLGPPFLPFVGVGPATDFAVVNSLGRVVRSATMGTKCVGVCGKDGSVTVCLALYGGLVGGGAAAPAPTVASISPSFAFRTIAGFPVVITGSGFTGATGAKINGLACGSFSVVNDTMILCTTPTLAAEGVYDVSVTNATGTGTLASSYTAIGNSAAWFRADLGVTAPSSQVTDLADQSGNGKHTTSAPGTRPTLTASWHNGKPAIHGDGTQFLDGISNILASPGGTYTVFFIGENAGLNADPSGGAFYTERKTSPYGSHQHLRLLVQYIYGDGVDSGANIDLHPNHFYPEVSAPFRCIRLMNGNGNAPVVLINGVTCNMDAGHQTTPTGDPGFFLFKNSVGQFWNGFFAEMGIIVGIAGAPTIALVNAYAAARYGL